MPDARPPNILFVLCDDLGYGDLSSYGSPTIDTPNLDAMASEGQRWTNCYSSSAICVPSRAGLMTGRYPGRPDFREVDTIADMLKNAGYHTALIGKWHLGMDDGLHPNDRGFDYYYGTPSSNDHFPIGDFEYESYKSFQDANYKVGEADTFNVPIFRQRELVEQPARQSQFTQRYTRETIDFIDAHADEPFFVYLAHNMPHVPLWPSEPFKGKSRGGLYGDVVEEIDWSMGQIAAALREKGLAEDTLIVFSSDNGPWKSYHELGGSTGPLRGEKGTCWDGGGRVPCVISWPGRIPAGDVDELVSHLDFFATFATLTGQTLPDDVMMDSLDILPVILEKQPSQREIFFFFDGFRDRNLWAVRDREFKLHVHSAPTCFAEADSHLDRPLLYDMTGDIGESHDVYAGHPDRAEKLLQLFREMNEEIPYNWWWSNG